MLLSINGFGSFCLIFLFLFFLAFDVSWLFSIVFYSSSSIGWVSGDLCWAGSWLSVEIGSWLFKSFTDWDCAFGCVIWFTFCPFAWFDWAVAEAFVPSWPSDAWLSVLAAWNAPLCSIPCVPSICCWCMTYIICCICICTSWSYWVRWVWACCWFWCWVTRCSYAWSFWCCIWSSASCCCWPFSPAPIYCLLFCWARFGICLEGWNCWGADEALTYWDICYGWLWAPSKLLFAMLLVFGPGNWALSSLLLYFKWFLYCFCMICCISCWLEVSCSKWPVLASPISSLIWLMRPRCPIWLPAFGAM